MMTDRLDTLEAALNERALLDAAESIIGLREMLFHAATYLATGRITEAKVIIDTIIDVIDKSGGPTG